MIRIFLWLLKRKNLSKEDRLLLTGHMLSTIGSLPLHGILTIDGEGRPLIKGVPLDSEKAIKLREDADTLLNNHAWQLVREQALYGAVSMGSLEAQTLDQVLFSRAAIWFSQQQETLLKKLAGTAPSA